MPPAQNVGIKALEVYFPSRYVPQAELESFLGASAGKYTIGLGQQNMSFCDDREDLYSLALTAVSSLLRKYAIDPHTIGRLEVGTETILDKAKSCKTVLMQLFGDNTDIEGIDTYNACYGGTSALLNAVNWVESSAWDGRDAIVVAGDIALYDTPAARPTGGAGCVAMLIGPDAPLVLEPFRGSCMKHMYDFYKADFKSEYPLVDGQFSNTCYLGALDQCYQRYQSKQRARAGAEEPKQNGNGHQGSFLDTFDYFVFHAPNCKLVSKGYGRLLFNDFKLEPASFDDGVPSPVQELDFTESLTDKALEKLCIALTKERFARRVEPSLTLPTNCGNMYTASAYAGLISLISNIPSDQLQGRRIGVFSYGSGLASTLFSVRVHGDTAAMARKINLHDRLGARTAVSPAFYDQMCKLRETAYQQKNYVPTGDVESLAPGTYYLGHVDEVFRRRPTITYGLRILLEQGRLEL
ncbi:putative hydroxymethylglutaryl-CoA synthase [Aspergillus clavatus NRRL 1]|uniref:Hydroxymethylglutaryl-CoA synthase n=1 Tax=Aspergillus clavatus (strain ATCC 1007 / CBS 513.65 / DSM 816 / NCTC 3887 / NRRL 1 / QM 1276 / 107) TaxID=344612 RepID=A1C4K2_ASPCL|nr:hydroxymethylglutaryl-CoA synthase, putative [Aspergillus clavatus NRRL 1]EAW15342.1 hydroxymethylglutaryl-CoA synthase, putative [Aspergillus clavatus NRRL 1]